MERDDRYALFYQNHLFQIKVREFRRDARDAVSQAVQESSKNFEVQMTQEILGGQNRYEGRMEEHERRVAQMIGSEARGALRGQRTICYKNIQYFSKHEKDKNSSKKARCTWSCSHTSFVVEESYMDEKLNKSTFPQSSPNLEHKEAQ